MSNLQKNRLLLTVLLSVVLLSPGLAQKPSRATQRIGPFVVDSIGHFSIRPDEKTRRGTPAERRQYIVLQSYKAKPIYAHSTQYDLFALRIEMTLIGTKLKPISVDATGKVKVVSHDEVTGDTTTITADKALYTATADPKDRGKIYLTGHVYGETTNKGLAKPFVLNNVDSATIEFLEGGDIAIDGNSDGGTGTISGQPYEPESKGQKP